jgi:ankyrin repeat protein
MLTMLDKCAGGALYDAETETADNDKSIFMCLFSEDSHQIFDITDRLINELEDEAPMVLGMPDVLGQNVIHYAALCRNASTPEYAKAVNRVLQIVPRSFLDFPGGRLCLSPLSAAAQSGTIVAFKVLLEAGASPTYDCRHNCPPVIAMASRYRSDPYDALRARMLVAAKADVNVCDENGVSAVELAVKRKDMTLARVLVGLGAKPEVRGDAVAEEALRDEQAALVAGEEGVLKAREAAVAKAKEEGKVLTIQEEIAFAKVTKAKANAGAGAGAGAESKDDQQETTNKRDSTPSKRGRGSTAAVSASKAKKAKVEEAKVDEEPPAPTRRVTRSRHAEQEVEKKVDSKAKNPTGRKRGSL